MYNNPTALLEQRNTFTDESAGTGKLDHFNIAVLLFLPIFIETSQLICFLRTTGCMTPHLSRELVCILNETLRHSLLNICQNEH